jgi:hypothetical protein
MRTYAHPRPLVAQLWAALSIVLVLSILPR